MVILVKNILRYLHKSYFYIFLVVGICIYCAQYFKIILPDVIRNHANDFLCIPIVLFVCQYVARLIKSDKQLRIPFILSLVVTLLYCIYFEYYLPQFNDRYTADIIDVIMYIFGLLFFYSIEYKRT